MQVRCIDVRELGCAHGHGFEMVEKAAVTIMSLKDLLNFREAAIKNYASIYAVA